MAGLSGNFTSFTGVPASTRKGGGEGRDEKREWGGERGKGEKERGGGGEGGEGTF